MRTMKTEMKWTHEAYPPFSYFPIPYYAVVLAYVAAWLLTLTWWQRRKSHLLKLHTAP